MNIARPGVVNLNGMGFQGAFGSMGTAFWVPPGSRTRSEPLGIGGLLELGNMRSSDTSWPVRARIEIALFGPRTIKKGFALLHQGRRESRRVFGRQHRSGIVFVHLAGRLGNLLDGVQVDPACRVSQAAIDLRPNAAQKSRGRIPSS